MKLVEKFLLLVLISFVPTAYGQQQESCELNAQNEIDVTGFASGMKLFALEAHPGITDVNPRCYPGNVGIPGVQSFIDDITTIQSVVQEITCQGGGNDCLVLSGNFTEFFSISRSHAAIQKFINEFSIRSKDYRSVAAKLIVAATYMGSIEESSGKTARGTETYSIVLRDDPPPVLAAPSTNVEIVMVTDLESEILGKLAITDTGTVIFRAEPTVLVEEVITSVRITQVCQFSHGPNTTDCLVIGDVSVPSSLTIIKGNSQDSLKALELGIAGYDSENEPPVSGDKIPTSVRLLVTLESGLKSRVDDVGSLGRVTNTNTLEYELSFNITGIPPVLVDTNTEQIVFETGKRIFSSIEVQGGGNRKATASIVIMQECEPSQGGDCVKLNSSLDSFGGKVEDVEDFLREIVVAPTSRDVLSATFSVTVEVIGSVANTRVSSKELKYSLTFKSVAPVEVRPLSGMSTGLDVLGDTPFNSITVTDGPGEPDTVRSVVIKFECSGGRTTCVSVNDETATVLKMKWEEGRTSAQVQSFLRNLEMVWDTDYKEPREATATIILETSTRDIFNDVIISRESVPSVYQLSFSIFDKPPMLGAPSTVQTIFRAGKRIFSSITVTDVDERSGVELITSVRITQKCKPNCARLGALSPGSFLGTTVRDTETVKVQDFSHEGASTAVVHAFLSSNIAMASMSVEPLSVTLTVTVGSVLRELNRQSDGLVYLLTFNGAPAVESINRVGLDVLSSFPFSSATVMDDPREPDTIRSVVIEFECSRGREVRATCVNADWSQIRGTAKDVENSLRALIVVWSADYTTPLVATARISLKTNMRNIFGDIVTHTASGAPRLSFIVTDMPPMLGDPSTVQTIFRAGKRVFSSITVTDVDERLGVELITSVRITQKCKPNCARLGLLPNASSMGFVTTPVGYTTDDEVVQDFSHGGASTAVAQTFLSSNIAMASTSEEPLSVTLTVTVGSVLRGLKRSSARLVYSLTFNGVPTVESTDREGLDVLESTPFSSIDVMDAPGETDTIRSVVIEFECSRGLEVRATCVNADVSQIRGTAKDVESSLRALIVKWSADQTMPLEATATITLVTSLRNIFGDIVTHNVSGAPRLSFVLPFMPPQLSDETDPEKSSIATGFTPLSSITIIKGDATTVSGIVVTLECVNGATTCASFVDVEPGDFSGITLEDAEMFLRGLQVRSSFASYRAKLTVSIVTLLNRKELPSNKLKYTLTFFTPGRSVRDMLIAPDFADDLFAGETVVNPALDKVTPDELAVIKDKVKDHCGSDYFADSDGDGVPNNVEAQLGTDCRNGDPENVAGQDEKDLKRPEVKVSGEQRVLNQLPFLGNLEGLGIQFQCGSCVEVLFLEIQPELPDCASASVAGNGSILFPGVNMSSCYLAGRFSSSPTGSEGSAFLYGALFPRPSGSKLYVLGIDKYGNWSVARNGVLETKIVYTPPVLSLGSDVYSDTDLANIGVELRGRRTEPSGSHIQKAPDFTLVGDTRVSGSFSPFWERDDRTVSIGVPGSRIVTLDDVPPGFVEGRSTLTVIQDSPPPFISISLQKDGSSAAVISLEDDVDSYSLNVSGGAQSVVTIVDGEAVVMEGGEAMVLEDVGDLLDRVRGRFDGVATLKVRVSSSDNTVEAQFPVFSSTKTAASAAAWTEAVTDRNVVIAGCLTDMCAPDNPFAYASVNLGPGSYLSHVIASSIRDFAVSFAKVRETLNEFVSDELNSDPDLNGTELLTDVISYSGAVSNVSETAASFVFDFRHKPFTENGRLVKRILLVNGEYKWRGVDNDDIDGSVWYTARRDSTCPSPDDDAAWTGTDNGLIPASDDAPVRCVRLDIVNGGLYANGSNGYYSGSIFGAGADAVPLAHTGGGRAYDSYDTWLIVFSTLAALIYGGSVGLWMLFGLASLLVFAVLSRRRRKRVSSGV